MRHLWFTFPALLRIFSGRKWGQTRTNSGVQRGVSAPHWRARYLKRLDSGFRRNDELNIDRDTSLFNPSHWIPASAYLRACLSEGARRQATHRQAGMTGRWLDSAPVFTGVTRRNDELNRIK